MASNVSAPFSGTALHGEQLTRLEAAIRCSGTVRELSVFHHFSKGIYARELHIPKGTVLLGKIHKHPNLNIISKGDISVLTDSGIQRLGLGTHLVSGYAHEATIWTTIHGTDETDPALIEAQFIAQNEAEYLAFCQSLTTGAP
ncbi:MAG: hypothetical protein RL748_3104 [Pseudomonadota bacterium]|jgi:hypothetical protein